MLFRRYPKNLLWMMNEIFNTPIEAPAECIPIRLNIVSWETLAIREKWDNVKTVSLCNKRNPTNVNAQKLKAQRELITHSKKWREYIQDQINKIRKSEDRQSHCIVDSKWGE